MPPGTSRAGARRDAADDPRLHAARVARGHVHYGAHACARLRRAHRGYSPARERQRSTAATCPAAARGADRVRCAMSSVEASSPPCAPIDEARNSLHSPAVDGSFLQEHSSPPCSGSSMSFATKPWCVASGLRSSVRNRVHRDSVCYCGAFAASSCGFSMIRASGERSGQSRPTNPSARDRARGRSRSRSTPCSSARSFDSSRSPDEP